MIKHHHYFVPNFIIDKLPQHDDEHKEIDQYFRKRRNYFLQFPYKRDKILADMRRGVIHRETRRLFDCTNTYNFSETPILVDEQVHSTKPSLNEALQMTNISYDFFHDKFQLESFDNRSSPIDLYVHYGEKYNNAFYDGLRFVFGDGDGIYFNNFLRLDIFMHELTHAVTDHKSRLAYENQPGALNEHLSDVFAIALTQRQKREKATASSWLIGEGIFNTSRIPGGRALRTFKNEPAYDDPLLGGIDNQPKHMRDYQNLENTEEGDYGGVHINVGILNRAFYEFCVLAETEVSDEWNNRSWKAPLSIWYSSYEFIKQYTTFEEFAKITLHVTRDDHPELQTQILKAWQTVGINV